MRFRNVSKVWGTKFLQCLHNNITMHVTDGRYYTQKCRTEKIRRFVWGKGMRLFHTVYTVTPTDLWHRQKTCCFRILFIPISYNILVTHNDLFLCIVSCKPLLCLNSTLWETKNDSHPPYVCVRTYIFYARRYSLVLILRINNQIHS